MNPEDRLSDALHATLDAAQPSPDLQDRIVERVSLARPRSVRFGWRPGMQPIAARRGLAGLIALIVVAIALVPLAMSIRSNAGPAEPSGSRATALSTVAVASELPSLATPAESLAHFDRDGLAFDYPASWHTLDFRVNTSFSSVLGFLGTGSGMEACEARSPNPSGSGGGRECANNLRISPGEVVVELSIVVWMGAKHPIDPTDSAALGVGQEYVTVGGLAAIFAESTDSTTTILDWTLSVPEHLFHRYRVHVEMKSPGVDRMRAQVEALVASIGYDPPVPVLNPADGPGIAAIGLTQAAARDPSLACFPKVPGATATATITRFPGYSALTKPLPVTCTTEMQPQSIGLWKMTLTESWTAASDRSAGSLSTTLWLLHDGTAGTQESGPAPSELPYRAAQ